MYLKFLRILSILPLLISITIFASEKNQDLEAIKKEINSIKNSLNDTPLNDLLISGQMTYIVQSSEKKEHKNLAATFSADLVVEKKIAQGLFSIDFQFSNGLGVDANFLGAAMVNNDVMEDINHHNQPYIARVFYERTFENIFNDFNLVVDIGKIGVNDFFDLGLEVSDQTSQFLNQAVNNNGAFDFVQDLNGNGYTHGLRLSLENKYLGFDIGYFSADSFLDNIEKKYSIVTGLKWIPEWYSNRKSLYQIYAFKNFGEYGVFKNDGSFVTSNSSDINTINNSDNNDKSGFGISINHALPAGIDIFIKYGKQDDNRDVRHYQDMDETFLLGFTLNGEIWSRENDAFGVAFINAKLTGNHKKAHELGYSSFFDRSQGIGVGNYDDENVLEAYYRISLKDSGSFSFDYQKVSNFAYNKTAKSISFYAIRHNISF